MSFTVVLLLTYAIPASAQTNSKVLDSRTVLDQLEEQMNKAGVSLFKDSRTRVEKISPNSTTINIGTNKTFTWADAGNSNYWGSGYGISSTCQASAAFCDGDIWGQWAPAPGGNGITYTGIELRWN